MIDIVLGIGHLGAANMSGSTIKTYALGSCVALVLFSPACNGVGMVHFALSDSSINPTRAAELPGYFANTGFPALMKKMAMMNRGKPDPGMYAKITGGATMIGASDVFNIGLRNVAKTTELLKTAGIPLKAKDTGGSISRTVSVEIGSDLLLITTPGRPDSKI